MKVHQRVKVPIGEDRYAEIFVDRSQIHDKGVAVYKSNSSVNGHVYVTVGNALKKCRNSIQDPRSASLEGLAMFDLYEKNYKLRRDFVIFMVERHDNDLNVVMSCRFTSGRRDLAEKAYFQVSPEYASYFELENRHEDFDIPF